MVQKARILRLQKDLDTTRAVHLKAKGDQSKGLLDLSLSTVENLSRQILEYERENSLLKNQVSLVLSEKQSAFASRAADDAAFVATQTISAINLMGDKLWGHANAYMDKTQRMLTNALATSASPAAQEVADRVNQACELFLDALEADVKACKSAVKRALAETEADQSEWGAGGEATRDEQ